MDNRRFALSGLILVAAAGGSIADESALPVSPGDGDSVAACSTFSWGAAAGAGGYLLQVFEATSEDPVAPSLLGDPVLEKIIDAPALSWSPATGQCLEVGREFVWFVRPLDDADSGLWSQGSRFRVAIGPDEHLTEAVRREVADQLMQPEIWHQMLPAVWPAGQAILPSSVLLTYSGQSAPLSSDNQIEGSGAGEGRPLEPVSFPTASALRISSDAGVVFDDPTAVGTGLGTGGIPAEGQGVRLMWYPAKAAFRAGKAISSEWNDSNIGEYSFAVGLGNTAKGSHSIALGGYATASGISSLAMGDSTWASGDGSMAMGLMTTASGFLSTAIGWSSVAQGQESVAMGDSNTASGAVSVAMGAGTTAAGDYSTAMGWNTSAGAQYSVASGKTTVANGQASTAMGWGTATSALAATVIGLNNATSGGTPGTYVSTDPLFVIGNGASVSSPTDALVMLKNGNTTLNGRLTVTSLASASATDLCINGSTLSSCSSSGRYKEEIRDLPLGLETVAKLRPVSFKWKQRDEADLGFVAEEVADIDPLLATYRDGQIEGVKYKQLTAVLVNAVKEQQAEIDVLRRQLREFDQLAAELANYRTLAADVAALKRSHMSNVAARPVIPEPAGQ